MQTTIIVPIYNAYAMLEGLFGALRSTVSAVPVIAIDDASPDRRVQAFLQSSATAGLTDLTILRNTENQGFVKTVNRGMQQVSGDVIILNQDTLPAPGWYSRILLAAAQPYVGTVTPLTNNGEIASVPELCVNNSLPDRLDLMAKACQLVGPPDYPEVPTAVGFCMLLKRGCIEQIGSFDAQRFGHGYGEENDFSRRAAAAGYRNILCDDAYVAHVGNQSFKEIGLQPNAEALQKVLERHPDYMRHVTDFIDNDPLRDRRSKIGQIYQQLLNESTKDHD